jgi:hypothetical protein
MIKMLRRIRYAIFNRRLGRAKALRYLTARYQLK